MINLCISNYLTGNASQSGEDNTNPKFWKTEKRVRFFIRRICKTSAWFWFVIVLVFLNTCTIAVQHYDQPLWLEEFLCKLTYFFVTCYETFITRVELSYKTISILFNYSLCRVRLFVGFHI